MNNRRFYFQLALTVFLSAICLIWLSMMPQVHAYIDLGIITLILFIILSVGIFILGKRRIQDPVRTRFISLTIANMMLKMVFSIGLVLVYYKLKNPEVSLFILPFLTIYIIFTIFETRFLLIMVNDKKK
jgi:hypothetical protein